MLSKTYEQAAFKMKLVDLANQIQPTLTGDFAQVQALMDDNQVVFAVWQDPLEPDGVGTMLIKGQRHLRTIIASKRAAATDCTAIPCTCAAQAEALRQVAGEKDLLH